MLKKKQVLTNFVINPFLLCSPILCIEGLYFDLFFATTKQSKLLFHLIIKLSIYTLRNK